MHGISLPVDALHFLHPEDEATLVARAAGRAAREDDGAAAETLYVRFTLAGDALAMPLASVAGAVSTLGRLTRVPRRAGKPIVACFIEGRPVTVCDGLELVGHLPRELAQLARAPAIIVTLDSMVRLAIAVQPPLDLSWTAARAAASASRPVGALAVSGDLADGTLLLDGADLCRKALGLLGGAR